MTNKTQSSEQAGTDSSQCSQMLWIGIDNGVSGSVAWVNENCSLTGGFSMPVFQEQDYVKKQQNVSRINVNELHKLLYEIGGGDLGGGYWKNVRVVLERPFVNPMMFRATLSAIRAWEATLIVLAKFCWPRIVVDSRGWQKAMLPTGCEGAELKKASVQVGCRLFPDHTDWIKAHGDADSLLIAEHARRSKL